MRVVRGQWQVWLQDAAVDKKCCSHVNGASGECDFKRQRWTRNVGDGEASVRVVCGPSGKHSFNA